MAPSPAVAEKRVALVIGNSTYTRVGKLDNPARDARAVEKMLRGAGFDTVEVMRDLGNVAMRRALRDFSDQARDADIAVVFYAGHGIEVNGSNYLIPVDAVLEQDIDVEDEAMPLERVSQVLEQAKRLRLVILDACRDNPFVHSMRRTMSTRSIGRGLAKVEVLTTDTLIAFAAKAGLTAEDGSGTNSPYTSAVVKHLATPGLDVRLAFGRVRDEVLQSTKGKQEPVYYGSLGGAEIALVPAAPTLTPSADVNAARVCREVEGMSNATMLAAMAAKHKGTLAADCIAARLEQLRQVEASKTTAAKVVASAKTEIPLTPAEAPKLSPKRAPAPLTASEERGLNPKDRFKECPECPEMVVVPAGSFTMGSPPDEKERKNDEVQLKYTFAKPFAVGRFEVTRVEWTAYKTYLIGPDRSRDRRPMSHVSWEDAMKYITWLSEKTGKPYRLLTEAEWEYVARAGTTTRYAFGHTITERQAKFSDGTWPGLYADRSVEVGSFPPNAWGLYDMHGNVWEWCSDTRDYSVGGPFYRVLRGGSWNSPPEDLRSARRLWLDYYTNGKHIGFRVARTL